MDMNMDMDKNYHNDDLNYNKYYDNYDNYDINLNNSNTINCDDCYSRDKKSCSKCKNCGFCVSGDDNHGICVFGDYKGPIDKPHYIHHSNNISKNFLDHHSHSTNDFDANNLYNNISSYCYKWIYQPDDFTYDSHEITNDKTFKLINNNNSILKQNLTNNINNPKLNNIIHNGDSEH